MIGILVGFDSHSVLKIRFYLPFLKVPVVHKGQNEVRREEKKPLTAEWAL